MSDPGGKTQYLPRWSDFAPAPILEAAGASDTAYGSSNQRCFTWSGDQGPPYESEGLETRYAIRLASTPGDHTAAMFLMRKRYEWRGYSADIMREDPSGVTLVASESGRVAATVTVGVDAPTEMAVESLYSGEVAQLRREGARLCEFTRLAVDQASRSLELLGALFHVAYLYARRMHDATHLLAEVNPRHVRFYERMLGFRVAGPQRVCPRVDAPALMIALPLDHAEDQIARLGGHRSLAQLKRSLYPYFFSAAEEDRILARMFGEDPARSTIPVRHDSLSDSARRVPPARR